MKAAEMLFGSEATDAAEMSLDEQVQKVAESLKSKTKRKRLKCKSNSEKQKLVEASTCRASPESS